MVIFISALSALAQPQYSIDIEMLVLVIFTTNVKTYFKQDTVEFFLNKLFFSLDQTSTIVVAHESSIAMSTLLVRDFEVDI